MRNIDFDDLWKNHLFDYKDGDLLVIDDITRLSLSDYENTKLAFVMAVFCVEGRMQVVVEGQEYRMGSGDFFVYMPGQVIGEILLSQHADVKVIAFAQRAIDRSLYLHKFVWQNLEYVKEHPLFTLSERERQGLSHYYQLLMNKTQDGEGSFQHDVVRLLFQALILEFQMFVDRRRGETAESDSIPSEKDSSVRQSTLVYRHFMALLAESNGRVRSVSVFADVRGSQFTPEDTDIIVSKSAADYQQASAGAEPVQMLGHSMRAVRLPKGGTLTYRFTIDQEGDYILTTAMIPTHAVDVGDIRYQVTVDDTPAVVWSLKEPFRSEEWKRNVLRAQALRHQTVHLSRGSHQLIIEALDDHIVVDQWILIQST